MIDAPASAPRTVRGAVHALAAAQKPAAGVPAYTRYVNRPLGRLVAAVAHVLRMTPNQVTVISGGFGAAALVLLVLAQPSWPVAVLVTAGMVVGYVLDSADGQLARLRGGGSPAGEWLDHVVDAARMPAVHLAVAIALQRFTETADSWLMLIPLGFLLVTTVRFFALMLAEQMRKAGGVDGYDRGGVLRSLLALPGDFGLLCLVFVLWPVLDAFLIVYGVLFVLNTVLLVLSLVRRYRELTKR